MKNTIKWVTPRFNTDRMVSDYTQRFYNPAAKRWRYLNAEDMSRAKSLSEWKSSIRSAWNQFEIRDVEVQLDNGQGPEDLDPNKPRLKVGSQLHVKALIKLGNINIDDVSVELYHGPVDSWGNIKDGQAVTMTHKEPGLGHGEHWFNGFLSCQLAGQQGVVVRILPKHEDLACRHELGLILWESPTSKTAVCVN